MIYARVSRDKSEGRSVSEQESEGRTACERNGWEVAGVRVDNDISASRFSHRQRPAWLQLVDELQQGQFDVLVLWEPSRVSRDLATWVLLLDTCRRLGITLHVTSHGRTYDPKNGREWRTLADDAVDSAYESEKMSERVQRAMRANAKAGKPHGRVPYGYVRHYDPVTKALVAQEADPETAPVVRRVIEQLDAGVPVSSLVKALNDEGIPSPAGTRWTRQVVRRVGMNRTYAGEREHDGQVYEGNWPALVEPLVQARVRRMLEDPVRKTTRPGRLKYLCSYIVHCGVCGAGLQGAPRGRRAETRTPTYFCPNHHASAKVAWLDEFVTRLLLARVDVREVRERMTVTDDAEVLAARAEVAALRERLAGWRDAAIAGQVSPDSLAHIEAGLQAEIAEADRRSRGSDSSALTDLLAAGDVRSRWDSLTLPAQRDLLRLLADVRLQPSRPHSEDYDRVEVMWR